MANTPLAKMVMSSLLFHPIPPTRTWYHLAGLASSSLDGSTVAGPLLRRRIKLRASDVVPATTPYIQYTHLRETRGVRTSYTVIQATQVHNVSPAILVMGSFCYIR